MVNFTKLVVSLAALIPAIAALPAFDNASGKYIITFKRGLSEEDRDSHIDFANEVHGRSLTRRGLSKRNEEGIRMRFSIHEHRSYSAVFDRATLNEINSHPAVEAVEPDEPYHIDRSTQTVLTQDNAPWGLASISSNPLSNATSTNATTKYVYHENGQGQGIFAYVVDSGIRISHNEFEGRAINGVNFVRNETAADLNGHGTHVAGTIGSKTYGVAKKATLIAVKVIHQGGSTSSETLLSAYQWVAEDGKKNNRSSKSVINISIGGPSSKFSIDAMENLHKAGFAVFASAGNSNKDSSTQSPGNAPSIFTVGSITATNTRSSFSNYGKGVDIFAPGSSIVSLGHLSDTAVATKSGTSMSTPHAAGEAAALKSRLGSILDKPQDVYDTMIELALKNVVKDPKGSPNILLNNGLGQKALQYRSRSIRRA